MSEHRLAAIMFTDIVGYTALMGRDEDQAFQVLRINREIHNTVIKRYNGILIKEMGDGILASFNSASDAVRCALDIQEETKAENISLRIGIHEGEVVYEGADVLGDGVNVASRLQELAEAGSIVMSKSVYREVKNKDGIFPAYIGEKILKNVDEPVKVYTVSGEEKTLNKDAETVRKQEKRQNKKLLYFVSGGIIILAAFILIWKYWAGLPSFPRAGTSAGKEKSIAVRPFWNQSEEKGTEYFANGVMDAILNNLCKISQLRVVSRSSSEKYRDSKLSAKEIAKELEVNYILEGSVQKYENKVRITIQLIDATEDKHLISEPFDRDYKDLLNLQSEIAQEIAGRLNATLSPKEKELIEKPATTSIAAYELYLRGRDYAFQYYNSSEEKNLNEAIHDYNRALGIDPRFALTYLGMGELYLFRYSSTEKYIKEGFADSVMQLCDRAIHLDPDLSEAYYLRGLSYIYVNNFVKALIELNKATSLNPNLSEAYWGLGISYLSAYNDQVNSIINFKKAEKLDKGGKYTPDILNYIGIIYLSIYDTLHAKQYYLKSIKYQKNNYLAYQQLWEMSFFLKKNLKNAIAYVDTICQLFPERCFAIRGAYFMYSKKFTDAEYWYKKEREVARRNKSILANRNQRHGYVFWNLGRKKEAIQYFNALIAYAKNPNIVYPSADYDLAAVYAVLDKKETAIEYFRMFIDSGFFGIWGTSTLILTDPMFDNIRDNKEFKTLLKKGQDQLARKREQIRELEEKGLL